jgi:hypothetical protein
MYDFNHSEDTGVENKDALLEALLIDASLHMDEEANKTYLESAGVKALVEAGVARKSTIVRLSKTDDYARRLTLAAIQKAKESNSPDWRKLRKAQKMKKMAIASIVKRYGVAVKKDVIKAQKALLKTDPMHYIRMPKITK